MHYAIVLQLIRINTHMRKIYYNILSEEDLAALLEYCKIEENWITLEGGEKESIYKNNYNKAVDQNIVDILNKINNTIATYVDTATEKLGWQNIIARFKDEAPKPKTGVFWDDEYWSMNPHSDRSCQHAANAVNCCTAAKITKGAVFYINDNYEGGELEYIEDGYIYKPVANSLVIHDANMIHGVKRFKGEDRYTFPCFIYDIT
jgi:hypothetical protein